MLSRLLKPSKVHSILFISLSNIGDIVLTFPVFDALCEAYPEAQFDIVVSAKGVNFFENNKRVHKIHILDKKASPGEKARWLAVLRRKKFDLVVDLRNSFLPFLVRAKRRTQPVLFGESRGHMREKHLRRIRSILKGIPVSGERHVLTRDIKGDGMVSRFLGSGGGFIVVAPGAADSKKKWTEEGFTALIRFLLEEKTLRVVIVGDKKDTRVVERILKPLPGGILNLCGQTSLGDLGQILGRARLALVNDSGIMHLASYLNVPTVALFGPTDPDCYGPWSQQSLVVRSFSGRMLDIELRDVVTAVMKMLA